MARKIKISNERKKRFARKEQKRRQDIDYRYEKNSEEMHALLKEYGSIEDAIRNAKRLVKIYDGRLDYAEHNPCTMVWGLVEELMELKSLF